MQKCSIALAVALYVVLAMLLGGCATVTRGTNSTVQFSSEPSEAQVRTSTGYQCTTPCSMPIGRKDEMIAVFTKPGYRTVEVPVRTQLAGAGAAGFAGNVVIGGVIGMGVDIATGAALEHCPNPVAVTLRKLGSSEPAANPVGHCQPQPSPAEPMTTASARDRIN